MGYTRHDAIIVTGWNDNAVSDAYTVAVEIGCSVSSVVDGVVNGYKSFMVAPDGSKEGWGDSDEGDAQREKFIAWLKENREKKWLDWIAVNFGGDDSYNARITDFHGKDLDD